MTLPSWARPAIGLSRKASWSLVEVAASARAGSRRPGRRRSAPCGHGARSKRSTRAMFSPSDQVDLQVAHEPAGGQPEVVAHHDDRLDVLAVALPQGGDQLRVLLAAPGVEPLLELVEDEQHLLRRTAGSRPRRSVASESTSPSSAGRSGHALRKPLQQPGLGLLGRRLDVDRQDVLGQPGQQARLDQRRLAAARRAVDQADLERLVGVGLPRSASSRTGGSRAGRPGPAARAAARGRSRRRARRTTAAPWGRS